jgi:hypothetical protein
MSETVQPGPDDLAGDAGSRPPVGPNPRRWLAVAIAAVVVLAVVAVAVLAIWRQRGLEPAAAGTAPTTTTSTAAGQKPLRVPDALGAFRRSDPFDLPSLQSGQGPIARGEAVVAGYRGPDGRTGVLLTATRPGIAMAAAQQAKLSASNPLTGEPAPFRRFPRAGLDIRCAQTAGGGAVCYLALPDLEVVLRGHPSAPRLADLLAEAYRKLV